MVLFADHQVFGRARQADEVRIARIRLRRPGIVVVVKQSRSANRGINSFVECRHGNDGRCKISLVISFSIMVIEEVLVAAPRQYTRCCRQVNAVAENGTLEKAERRSVLAVVSPGFPLVMACHIKYDKAIGSCEVRHSVGERDMSDCSLTG